MPSLHLRGETPETLAAAFPGLDLTLARRVVRRRVGENGHDLEGVRGLGHARAQEILKRIDQADFDHRTVTSRNSGGGVKKQHPSQLQLFSAPGHPVVDQLEKIEPNNMTPRQALEELYRLKGLVDKK